MGFFDMFKKKNNVEKYAHSAVVYISGMNCSHCSSSVEAAFNALNDTYAKVDLEKKCAFVCSMNELLEDKLKETVEKTGFAFVSANIEK